MNDVARFEAYEHDDVVFEGLRVPGANLQDRRFTACEFRDCAFPEADFTGTHFNDCAFTSCDLSMATVEACAFTQCRFVDCKIMGANWAVIEQEGRFLKPFDFERCTLDYCTFIGLKLAQVGFIDCVAHDVDYSECDLTGADFREADLAESRFMHADLRKADFRAARNYSIVPSLNQLEGAKFSLPEAASLLTNMGIILDDTKD